MGAPPPPRPGDAVLFDLDGTLLFLPVDVEGLRGTLRAFFLDRGVDLAFRPLLPKVDEALRLVLERRGQAEARAAERWAAGVIARAEVAASPQILPRRGALAALEALRGREIPVAVVSNNTRSGVETALAAVGVDPRSLAAVVSREDVPAPKPAPDGVLLALQVLEARGWAGAEGRARRAFLVGDAPADAEAARAAACIVAGSGISMLSLGLPGGRVSLESLPDAPFDHRLEGEDQLRLWAEALAGS